MEDKDLPVAARRAREPKEDLEEEILGLLIEFTQATGLNVVAVNVGCMQALRASRGYVVTTDVEL